MSAFSETGRTARVTRWTASATASVLLWISRTTLSVLVVFPLLQAIKASGMVGGPDGDTVLFRPGSLLLLEMFRLSAPAFGAALRTALLLGALAALVQLLPLAVAFDLLCRESEPLSARFQRALGLLPRFLGLGTIALLSQAALLLLASLLSAALKSPLQGGDERVVTLAPLGLLLLALLGCGFVGCVLDIARAALVQGEHTWSEALVSALTCVRERPWAVLSGGYPVASANVLGSLCCVWLVARLDLSQPAMLGLTLSFVAHQAALLFAVAWRVRWLRYALTLSAASHR